MWAWSLNSKTYCSWRRLSYIFETGASSVELWIIVSAPTLLRSRSFLLIVVSRWLNVVEQSNPYAVPHSICLIRAGTRRWSLLLSDRSWTGWRWLVKPRWLNFSTPLSWNGWVWLNTPLVGLHRSRNRCRLTINKPSTFLATVLFFLVLVDSRSVLLLVLNNRRYGLNDDVWSDPCLSCPSRFAHLRS